MEGRRNDLFLGRARQQIAGKLLGQELVVGQIAVEGINHPIAIAPHIAEGVLLIALAVSVTRHVEPYSRPTLTVGRRGEQPIHPEFVSISGAIVHKRFHFLR